MLPATIPIFPLPNAVLFPSVFLPLHIFEARYRQMVADALGGDRIIGMTLLRPGFEQHYEQRPAIYEVGCAGVITHAEKLADGRYDIVLCGMEKFRVTGEDTSKPYRLAYVQPIAETITDAERVSLRRQRQRLEEVLAAAVERTRADPRFPAAVPDEEQVNALAQYIQFDPLERQALLERNGPLERCRGLIELLEIQTLSPPGTAWKDRAVH
jgi:Lon protease-like protein